MPRLLKANEIEVRVGQITDTGCSLLLYLDARSAMKILDETFGTMGWQRTHEVINGNLFCNISVFDHDTAQWITRQDVGVESYTEKEKGESSDSFKRSCINWGIARELYTAPFIWINLKKDEISEKNGKKYLNYNVKFRVSAIEYTEDRRIKNLTIEDSKGIVRYTFVSTPPINTVVKTTEETSKNKTIRKTSTKKSATKKEDITKSNDIGDDLEISPTELSTLCATAIKAGYTTDSLEKMAYKKFKCETLKDLKHSQFMYLQNGFNSLLTH